MKFRRRSAKAPSEAPDTEATQFEAADSEATDIQAADSAPVVRRSWILRRIDIGPRLLLFLALPILALLTVIGLLVNEDIERLQDLRQHEVETAEITELVGLRASLQEERHRVVENAGPAAIGSTVDIEPTGVLAETFRVSGSTIDVVQRLREARRLADSGQRNAASLAFTSVIDELAWMIDARLAEAPLGAADAHSESLSALLRAQEAFLREDLHVRIGSGDPLILSRLRTEGLLALERFSDHASPAGVQRLETLTVSDSWRYLSLTEAGSFEAVQGSDDIQWAVSADVRRTAFVGLIVQESAELRASAASVFEVELARLLGLAAIIAGVLGIAALGAMSLRRSIVRPLSRLTINARNMANGEIVPIDDNASDEIAEVGRAFSSLAGTVQHLVTDIDTVSEAIEEGQYDKRIDTEPLRGDWKRLGTTVNSTLATTADHHAATNEELDRRTVMTEISNAAVLAESAPEITSTILHHLPKVLAGAHAHLHEHPSGPPSTDLGVVLEPSFSALEVPTLSEQAQRITVADKAGVASLVEFPEGPPAVLALMFGEAEPAQIEPLISLVETAARILAQAHRRQIAESDATHSREHDLLTGLANSAFLERWFEDVQNGSSWMAVGVTPLDLDAYDGSFGRDARNLVLSAVGGKLEAIVEEMAMTYGVPATLARTEEPEFVALVPHEHGDELAATFAREFSDAIIVDGTPLTIGLTIGYAELGGGSDADDDFTQTLTNVATAIRRADGRTTEIIPFEERYRDDVRRRTELIQWLSQAIENRDLTIQFQPVVNAVTTEIEGYECLVRGSRNGTPVSPGEFIPLAEETNMIVSIGEFTLREACAALPFLRGDAPYVAVNLSPIELSDPHLLDRIDTVLTQSNVDRSRVVFEITEGATTTPADVELLKRIRRLGVKIAIDDFGSGQSNLSYLNTLPAQILKLDRSLVTPMVDDTGAASVVRKAVEMAHDLGMTVVGEGVETNDELNALRRVRCDRIQGWLTGRPAPLEEFIEITVDRPVTQISKPQDHHL